MKRLLAAMFALAVAPFAAAQTKWDLPTAYPASNFHTENIQQFAGDVDKATGGKLTITVHANASLFKASAIKRAVQGGQAQLGEILLVNYENEDPLYGLDGIPFLATSYADSLKLYKARNVMEPIFEREFAEHSYGFRPQKGCRDALRRVKELLDRESRLRSPIK